MTSRGRRRIVAGGGRVFLLAISLATLSFLSATGIALRRGDAIHGTAHNIIESAVPGLQHLVAARSQLHNLQLLLLQDTTTPTPGLEQRIRDLNARVRGSLTAYRLLPIAPGEPDDAEELERRLARVEAIEAQLLQLSEAGGPPQLLQAALAQLNEAIEVMGRELVRLEDLEVMWIGRMGGEIDDRWTSSRLLALGLDALSVLVTIGAALVAWRLLRRSLVLETTHQRATEERAQELELFASRVAHDILSPLASTRLALETSQRWSRDERVDASVRLGLRSLTRVSTIVDGLLEFARAGAPATAAARTDVAALVRDLLDGLAADAATARVELVAQLAPGLVSASKGVMTSIVSNLVRNAMKYMGDAQERRVTVTVSSAAERVRVEVADTGPGLPPGTEDKVFNPYIRASTHGLPGLGLGLATVKRLAEAHGGHVGVRSTPGKGSTFWVELPAAPARL